MSSKELVGFKVGDEVEPIIDDPLFNTWLIKHGMVGKPLIVSALHSEYLHFSGDSSTDIGGWFKGRFRLVTKEPDYHVYPDTPVGTELVVIRDTKTKSGRFIHQGTPVTLTQSYYSADGAYRFCRIPKGLTFWIDCDDLMLKGYPLSE